MPGQLVRKYRRYSLAERQAIVAECAEPGASVSRVARRHDVNTNVVFRWRRQMRDAAAPAPPRLLPVVVGDQPATATRPVGSLEVTLASGHRIRVTGEVPSPLLEACLRALR